MASCLGFDLERPCQYHDSAIQYLERHGRLAQWASKNSARTAFLEKACPSTVLLPHLNDVTFDGTVCYTPLPGNSDYLRIDAPLDGLASQLAEQMQTSISQLAEASASRQAAYEQEQIYLQTRMLQFASELQDGGPRSSAGPRNLGAPLRDGTAQSGQLGEPEASRNAAASAPGYPAGQQQFHGVPPGNMSAGVRPQWEAPDSAPAPVPPEPGTPEWWRMQQARAVAGPY